MSESPNKLIRFWQELKRRKVFSVVTTYAATSYIIIEAVNNLIGPLHLPDWLATLVVILLIIGLPVVVILSWIFDFTPQGIKKTESIEEIEGKEVVTKPVKRKLRASYVLNAVLIIAVIILAYPKIFKRDTLERLRSSGEKISVAVMPFQNMTNDKSLNVWQEGVQNEIITSLTNSDELRIRQTETINSLIQSKGITNYESITPLVASALSLRLDADAFIIGTIKQAGTTIRLNAQIIDPNTKNALRSFQIDGSSDEILNLIDTLSVDIRNSLEISKFERGVTTEFHSFGYTTSSEAYKNFIYGQDAFLKGDYSTAIQYLSQSLRLDSSLIHSTFLLAFATLFSGDMNKAKYIVSRIHNKRDQISHVLWKTFTDYQYALLFETPTDQLKYIRQSLQLDDQLPFSNFDLGKAYLDLRQYDEAIPAFETALGIYKKWKTKPVWVWNYTALGLAYHETGQYREEKKLYKKAELDFPENSDLIYRQAVLSLTLGDTVEAKRYIEKFKTIQGKNSVPEAGIMTDLANIYLEAGILDNAEDFYRQALSVEPESDVRINNLAYFLIDKDRNIKEGLEINDKALESNPENYNYLHTKGWGLYKQGKYQQALEILQKSWNIRRKQAVYDHEAYLHLEAVKKAVAGLKNN